jgi:hypothetical protein
VPAAAVSGYCWAALHRRAQIGVLWLALIALVLTAPAARAEPRTDEREQLELAMARFHNGDFEEAGRRFQKLLSRGLDPRKPDHAARRRLFAEARPYYAAVLVWQEKVDEADAIIYAQLFDDPFYQPPPGEFHQKLEDRFIAVRARHPELEQRKQQILEERQKELVRGEKDKAAQEAWLAELKRRAAEERIVERRSRWIALLPLGVGQFQNGNTGLGVFFATSELVALGGTIASGIVANDRASVDCRRPDPESGQPIDCAELEQQFLTARAINWVSFSTTLVLVAAGIIEAQVAFVPEQVTTRKRDLPRPPRVEPVVTPAPQGALMGLRARF